MQDSITVVFVMHVDKINHDDATKIAQAKLTCDRVSSFHIGLEHSVIKIFATNITPGIHIDRCERFGLVNHEIAARFQVDASRKCTFDFGFNPIQIKDWSIAAIESNFFLDPRHIGTGKTSQMLQLSWLVNAHTCG